MRPSCAAVAFFAARLAATTRERTFGEPDLCNGAVVEVDHLHGARARALDEAVLLQAAQGLADRRGADGETLGEPALGDLLS